MPPWRGGCARQAACCWARPTPPSSATARPRPTACSRRRATLGPRPDRRRLERRLGRRRRRLPVPDRRRLRRRGIDPDPVELLRRGRHQAVARSHLEPSERNPRGGLITHGPIARTVSDAALMLDVMAGSEPGDPFVAPVQTSSFLDASGLDPGSLRVGMLVTSDKWIDPQVVAAVEQAADLLASLGHHGTCRSRSDGPRPGIPGDG